MNVAANLVKRCVGAAGLLVLALLLTSCGPRPTNYSTSGLTVTFPNTFEVRDSEEDTPKGKVRKTGAVCGRPGCDLAVFTTIYPEALVKDYSEHEVLKRELDMVLKQTDAILSSLRTNTASAIPCLHFTFEVPKESHSHGEGLLFYQGYRTLLVSALYVERSGEAGAFLDSVRMPGGAGASQTPSPRP